MRQNYVMKGCMRCHTLNQLQEIEYQRLSVLQIVEQLYRIVDKMVTIVETRKLLWLPEKKVRMCNMF